MRAQQSKGRGRVDEEEDEDNALVRRDWLARCSRADWYCFSFWRLGMVLGVPVSCVFGSDEG